MPLYPEDSTCPVCGHETWDYFCDNCGRPTEHYWSSRQAREAGARSREQTFFFRKKKPQKKHTGE